MWRMLRALGWVLLFAGAVLIAENSFRDFRPGGDGVFVEQKGEVGRQPLWLFALRVHVVAGIVCLASVLPQFSRRLLRRLPFLHRWSGRVYAASVLLFVCPTGFYLALFAKGGLAGQSGFLLLGALTFHTTWRGVAAMLGASPDLVAHRAWMTRSFIFAASAITFRILHLIFFFAGLPEESNYLASLWLSIAGNAAVAEGVLRLRSGTPWIKSSLPTASSTSSI